MPQFSFPHLLEMALMAVVLLFSIVVHEVAHGYVALRNGDSTARLLGRLTLNPIPHIDPIGSILLPLLLLATGSPILFGWARPVPVNPLNFRNYRWGEITVSAAGPLSNLALAVLFSYLLRLGPVNLGLMKMALWGVQINIFLALFNLIPIPPWMAPISSRFCCPGTWRAFMHTWNRWASSSFWLYFTPGLWGCSSCRPTV